MTGNSRNAFCLLAVADLSREGDQMGDEKRKEEEAKRMGLSAAMQVVLHACEQHNAAKVAIIDLDVRGEEGGGGGTDGEAQSKEDTTAIAHVRQLIGRKSRRKERDLLVFIPESSLSSSEEDRRQDLFFNVIRPSFNLAVCSRPASPTSPPPPFLHLVPSRSSSCLFLLHLVTHSIRAAEVEQEGGGDAGGCVEELCS
eukprot:766868-Hanusia_phi.AAC.4